MAATERAQSRKTHHVAKLGEGNSGLLLASLRKVQQTASMKCHENDQIDMVVP